MLKTEERLFDKYKSVDNICRDMFSSQSGISQYITEMEQNSFLGQSTVPSWDGDYRRLKRIRWLRNQIAHESSATDCNEEDVLWLEEFHHRLLMCQDPLALLGKVKANSRQLNSPSQRNYDLKDWTEQKLTNNNQSYRREGAFLRGMATLLIMAAIVAGVVVLLIWYRMLAL